MPRSALLFDLDGTMLHTDAIHQAVFADLMAPHGHVVDTAFYMAHIHGRLNHDIFADLLPGAGDPQALSDAKEAEFRRRLPRPYPSTPGLSALLDRAQAAGMGLAVVTNANRLNAHAMLDAVGERARFAVIISGEECAHGKPHPAPYLAAMEALGVAPADCIAFEDSPSGIRSAAASGAFTVGIRSALDDTTLRALGAHLTLSDFTDAALSPVLSRFEGAPA